MITPINGHLLIQPIKHDSFTLSQQESFQEIGIVVEVDEYIESEGLIPEVGDKVYFDAWLAAKFPSGDPENPYWLVKYEDIRAFEEAEESEDDAES